MSSDAIKCFRTVTRCGIFRQVTIAGVTTLVPLAIASPPEDISINPGDKIEKTMTKRCDGAKIVDFTFTDGSEPEVELKFSKVVMELESLCHGRVVAPATGSVEVMVFTEFNSEVAPAARTTGTIGFSVVAQTGSTTKAQLFYIDPTTKVAKKITIEDVDATLTSDQATIDAALEITLSPALIAKKVNVYGWVPCLVSGATVMTATPLGLVTIFAQGVNFDDTARSFVARNCSRAEGSAISDKSERSAKFSILPDPLSISGLGWDTIDVNLANAC